MSIIKNLCAFALLVGVASVAACTPFVAYPPGEEGSGLNDVAAVAEYVRPASDPNLLAGEYEDCNATGTSITSSATTSGGGTATARNGSACDGPVAIRRGGQNIRHAPVQPAPAQP